MIKLEQALIIARANPIQGLPQLGAVLTDGVREFTGWNQRKTHPLQARFCTHPSRIYLHAEIDVLSQAFRNGIMIDREKAKLYVARVLKNGQPALAKPCPGCFAALEAFGIKRCYWTES